MNKVRIWLLLACSLVTLSGWVQAATPAESLLAKLAAMDGSRSQFLQQTLDARGRVLDTSEGELLLARPQVRWNVLAPFPQVILLQQDQLQVYDPDLEQLTQRTLGDSWTEVPLALLTRTQVDLTRFFEIAQPDNSLAMYSLVPLNYDALVKQLVLNFNAEHLVGISIFDHAGQVTEIHFSDYQGGLVLESDAFQLAIPPGTEIVRG